MNRRVLIVLLPIISVTILLGASLAQAMDPKPVALAPVARSFGASAEELIFDELLSKYQDLTYERLHADLKPRAYAKELPFDPAAAPYFSRANTKLQLNDRERELFKRNGFVSVDRGQRYSFGSAYYAIYTYDLPVLITADSILHALHSSYDQILQELELTLFAYTVGDVLAKCHEELVRLARQNTDERLTNHYRDVDLYLTVARNLLAGAGADPSEKELAGNIFGQEAQPYWDERLLIQSKLDQDAKALEVLLYIQALTPWGTELYGRPRRIDYSQFRPRGHYTKSLLLRRYFRAMMWLGRVDCGWVISRPDPQSGVQADVERELGNAVLLSELLVKTDTVKRLKALDDIINFLVGQSDNLSVFALLQIRQEQGITALNDLNNTATRDTLKQAITAGKYGKQRIRSQYVESDLRSPDKVSPPAVFQLFGQRFIIDSFLLSQVVYDSIIYEDRKMERWMPTGLDVMAMLGNDEAVPLLADELSKYLYSANLKAGRMLVDLYQPDFWRENLYNLWLDALRTLDDDLSQQPNFPQVMRTQAWQRKQLQTQLASWAELRHDTILYAKQSYTAVAVCEYPTGYVEPYPQFYARVKFFAEEAARLIASADYSSPNVEKNGELGLMKMRQVAFLHQMAAHIGQLEDLAKKELAAQPFTKEEQIFLKKTIDARGGGSGGPTYDGWYVDLFYAFGGSGEWQATKWDPTVADVHTDPNFSTVLEVAVGDVNFLVAAIDNQADRQVYVGPVFSYYEFHQPMTKRLTDPEWQQLITSDQLPSRPQWTEVFQGPRRKRE